MKLQKLLLENKKIRVLLVFTLLLWLWVLIEFVGNQFVVGKNITTATDFCESWEEVLEADGCFWGSSEEWEQVLVQIEKGLSNESGKGICIEKCSSKDLEKEVYEIKKGEKVCGSFTVYPMEEGGLLLKLELKQKSKEAKLYSWKETLDQLAEEQGIKGWQSYYYTSCPISGKLTKKEQEKIARDVFRKLSAKQVFSCQVEDMLNWYGNTEKIKDKIHTNDSDINVQVAFSYEEKGQRTRCYIGTPILNQEY